MRMFASDRIGSIMERLKWPEDEPIEAKMVTKAVENAQRQIEELNFERRKNVLKYDEVMNAQRQVIYERAPEAPRGRGPQGRGARDGRGRGGRGPSSAWRRRRSSTRSGTDELVLTGLTEVFPTSISGEDLEEMVELGRALGAGASRTRSNAYEEKEQALGSQTMRELERLVLLNITDTKWREHLYEMDYLQEGIHLRAYAQRDPLTEYRREAYMMFEELTESIQDDFVKYIYRVELVRQDEPGRPAAAAGADPARRRGSGRGRRGSQAKSGKVPRNAPCPCGSGKKYKKCHGAVA